MFVTVDYDNPHKADRCNEIRYYGMAGYRVGGKWWIWLDIMECKHCKLGYCRKEGGTSRTEYHSIIWKTLEFLSFEIWVVVRIIKSFACNVLRTVAYGGENGIWIYPAFHWLICRIVGVVWSEGYFFPDFSLQHPMKAALLTTDSPTEIGDAPRDCWDVGCWHKEKGEPQPCHALHLKLYVRSCCNCNSCFYPCE